MGAGLRRRPHTGSGTRTQGDTASRREGLGATQQFGLTRTGAHKKIALLLDKAEAEVNTAKRIKLYKQINVLLADFLPAVPYAHSKPGVAVERRVRGYKPSPVGTESFYGVQVGGQ